MKRKWIIWAASCLLGMITATNVFAQTDTAAIEIKLKLLQQPNTKGTMDYALGVSIINHLNRDIYIPNFQLFASYSGVHVYLHQGNRWREVSLFTHNEYNPVPPTCVRDTIKGVTYIADTAMVYFDANNLSNSYKRYSAGLFSQQDSIIKAFYAVNPNAYGIPAVELPQEHPLFFKAGQVLDNYMVMSLDFLASRKFDYKIAFNTEARDTARYYRAPIVYLPRQGRTELHYPKYIYGYQLYYPDKIAANTLYLTPPGLTEKKN